MQKIITTSNFVTGLIYVEPRGEEIGLSGELGIDTSPLDPDDFICELEDGGIRLRETPATISISYEGVVDAQNYSPCKTDGEFVYLSSGIREKFYGNQLNLLELSRTRDVFVYSYPISLYTPRGAIPVFLLVVVW